MKIVVVAAMFPPAGHGGAEDCARSFAQWAAANGHEVTVVMAATRDDDDAVLETRDGAVRVHRIRTDHIYPVANARDEAKWKKPVWHLQDHLDPRTATRVARAVEAERPDVIVVHYVQGFGYRTITRLSRLGVPIAMVLHDLGLICWRMGMFRNGVSCDRLCASCQLSAAVKRRIFADAARRAPIGLISPSHANLATIARYFPVRSFPHRVILNTKTYPVAARTAPEPTGLRLLYAGKLEPAKGIDRLASAVAALPRDAGVTLAIAGSGSLDAPLRRDHAGDPRFSFLGFVTQEDLARQMAASSLLCVPSVWPENSPGVVAQAILNGLPVIATNHGGLPELVRDGVDGRILKGDDVTAWREALTQLAQSSDTIPQWGRRLDEVKPRFAIDAIGAETIRFLSTLAR